MKLGGFDTLIHRAPCLPFPPAHPPAHPLLRHPTTLAAWSTAPVAPLPISGDETEEKDQARGRNVEKRQRWNGMQGGGQCRVGMGEKGGAWKQRSGPRRGHRSHGNPSRGERSTWCRNRTNAIYELPPQRNDSPFPPTPPPPPKKNNKLKKLHN